MVDDITQGDEFMKYTSGDEFVLMRLTRAPTLVCCSTLPKIPRDEHIMPRLRIIQFPDHSDIVDEGEPSQTMQEQFLNYVILHGQELYHQNMIPLIHQRLTHQPGNKAPDRRHKNLKEWFARRIQPEPGAVVSLADLTKAYIRDHRPRWDQPERIFYVHLWKELPGIARSLYPAASGLVLAGYRLIHQLGRFGHSASIKERQNILPLQQFELRAECQVDVFRFLRRLSIVCIKERYRILSFQVLPYDGFSDFGLEFTTSLSLERIREILAGIQDAHVMLETVALFNSHTSEMKWGEIGGIYEARVGKPYLHPDEETLEW